MMKQSFASMRKIPCWDQRVEATLAAIIQQTTATMAATIQPLIQPSWLLGMTNGLIPGIYKTAFLLKLFTMTKSCWEQPSISIWVSSSYCFLWQSFPSNPPHRYWLHYWTQMPKITGVSGCQRRQLYSWSALHFCWTSRKFSPYILSVCWNRQKTRIMESK